MAVEHGNRRHMVGLATCRGDADWLPDPILSRAVFFWWSLMSDALKQAEHYRDLEKRYLHLAEIGSSTKRRDYYLRIADHYGALAEAEELSTPGHMNSG